MLREEAIARIREHMIIHKSKEPRAIYITEALEMAIKALETPPNDNWDGYSRKLWKAAYERGKEDAEPKWIPVSDRLPEENEEYHSFFVTDSNYDISIAKFYLPLNPDIDRPYWSGLIDVIAWMPIFIEPYKEESEDKK